MRPEAIALTTRLAPVVASPQAKMPAALVLCVPSTAIFLRQSIANCNSCIAPRAASVVEAITALVLADQMERGL